MMVLDDLNMMPYALVEWFEETLVGSSVELNNEFEFDVNFDVDEEFLEWKFIRPDHNVSVKWLYDGIVEFSIDNWDGPLSS